MIADAEASELRALVRQAAALRVVLAIVIHFSVPEAFFAPDQAAYHVGAARLAAWWSGEGAVYPERLLEGRMPAGYYYVVAALYLLLGASSLWPKVLNATLGAYSVRLTYQLARKVIGAHAPAFFSARLCAFLPSMVLWSILNIRDIWVIVVILIACNVTLDLQQEFRVWRFALLAGAVLALLQLRAYLLFAVAGPIVVALVVQRGGRVVRNAILGMLAASVLIYANYTVEDRRGLRSADLEILQELRSGTAIGGKSNFAPDADISTPTGALTFLPLGLAFFLFAPFPWVITGVRQMITLPEMLLVYSLVPGMVRGVLFLARRRLSESIAVLMISGGLVLGYALGQANAGTAYRHRAQVLPFLMMFAAAGRWSSRHASADETLAARPQPTR